MFDLFRGPNHLKNAKGKIKLVSFNSILVNSDFFSKLEDYSALRSSRILT